ncbi:hypothetical protein Tsp_11005 [Trichinella spiralis]|uniref:hypothetical protein n=1 Tax=Trichinella spiralis TaxID=6334 RepID=UPI0001EFC00D|nr:hypothetical protein Tsp_11005 [Trichinella spiralis]
MHVQLNKEAFASKLLTSGRHKFECTKTGFQRCSMQITIAIKGALSSIRTMKKKVKAWLTRKKARTARSRTREEKRAFLNFEISSPNVRRRVLTKSMFLLWCFLPDKLHSAISPVHIILRHRLEFVLSKKFQCTKTGFERCAMQITIAIKVPYRQ